MNNELYENLNFNGHPFSTFSAEEEKDYLSYIYVKPLFYNSLENDLSFGHSRFILGARGVGKTALIMELITNLDLKNIFTVMVDDFNGISLKNNQNELLNLVIKNITTKFSIFLNENRKTIKKLNTKEKENLSFIIRNFFKPLSDKEYQKVYNTVDSYKKRNNFRRIWNIGLKKPTNTVINASIEIASDTFRKSLGLPASDISSIAKDYLPGFDLEKISPIELNDILKKDVNALKKILEDISDIIKKVEFNGVVVFFDKIDEYPKLNSQISSVSDFLTPLLKDTTVLMNSSYSFAFALWNVLKPELDNKGVRFDKIKPIDITWRKENLKEILEKRLMYFSSGQANIDSVIKNNNLDLIIKLSNNSPRYLLRQLSYIYDQQSEIDSESKILSLNAVQKGQLVYSKSFDYYAVYPGKRGSKSDILINVNRLLKIGKIVITTKDFVDVFKVSTKTGVNYIKVLKNFSLIKMLTEAGNKGAKKYKVSDPVVEHLILNEVEEIKR